MNERLTELAEGWGDECWNPVTRAVKAGEIKRIFQLAPDVVETYNKGEYVDAEIVALAEELAR